MNELLANSWRGLAIRGAASLVFGILAALWPGLTLMWLVVLFAGYAIVSGLTSITAAVQNLDLLYQLGQDVANSEAWPQWKPGAEFVAIRAESDAARQ